MGETTVVNARCIRDKHTSRTITSPITATKCKRCFATLNSTCPFTAIKHSIVWINWCKGPFRTEAHLIKALKLAIKALRAWKEVLRHGRH